jgi:hypothetical protein
MAAAARARPAPKAVSVAADPVELPALGRMYGARSRDDKTQRGRRREAGRSSAVTENPRHTVSATAAEQARTYTLELGDALRARRAEVATLRSAARQR